MCLMPYKSEAKVSGELRVGIKQVTLSRLALLCIPNCILGEKF